MILKRIGNDRNMSTDIERIEIVLNRNRYKITESFGKLNINKAVIEGDGRDEIAVFPSSSNVIEIL